MARVKIMISVLVLLVLFGCTGIGPLPFPGTGSITRRPFPIRGSIKCYLI